jgi:chemotaxis protein MotB
MSQKRKKAEEHGESPIGFVMFGDLMSQMLCFFILLFVFASQYISKTQGTVYEDFLKKISDNFKKVVEVEQKPKDSKQETKAQETPKPIKASAEQLKIAEDLKNLILDEKLNDYVNVIVEEKKVRIVFKQPVLFDTGKAELKETASSILSDIGKILIKTKNPIDIEGHTDNVPIHTPKYDSNWDLSFDRAYSVIKFMVNSVGMSPIRMHAIGYGEYRPIAPNDTPENREKNRRIEINVLFNEMTRTSSSPNP